MAVNDSICTANVASLQNVSLAVVGMGEKLMIIDDEKVQPYVSSSSSIKQLESIWKCSHVT